MRVRASSGEGNAVGVSDSQNSRGGPLLSLRSAFILGASLLTAALAGVLTYLMTASLAGAFLAAGPAGGAMVTLLNAVIG